MDILDKTTKEFKKKYEVNDAEERIIMKKNVFEACLTMAFMRGSEKRKYGDLIHDLSIQYAFKNDQYTKTLQEGVDNRCPARFKVEKNNDKSTTQKKN